MISESVSKLIRSLRLKKYRDRHRLYVAEGEKLVGELLASGPQSGHRIVQLFAPEDWLASRKAAMAAAGINTTPVTAGDIKKLSTMVTPQPVLATVTMPDTMLNASDIIRQPVLGFEDIRDPGNLGTIIRTADWFGIGDIICSPGSVDVYNPKVVQSTMGAIARVRVHYMELVRFLNEPELEQKPVAGTFLDGEDLFRHPLEKDAVVLFGNESRGISGGLEPCIDRRICIPAYRDGAGAEKKSESESLNIAASVAVICAELRRPTRNGN